MPANSRTTGPPANRIPSTTSTTEIRESGCQVGSGGTSNRTAHPVTFELQYPPRLSRWYALARIILNPLISVICLAIIAIHAVAALTKLFTIMLTGAASLRLQAFQVRMLGIQGRTFAFFLSLTDRLPWA